MSQLDLVKSKREIIAWKIWAERQTAPKRRAVETLLKWSPSPIRSWMGAFISEKFMGGTNSKSMQIVATACFHLVNAVSVFLAMFRGKK